MKLTYSAAVRGDTVLGGVNFIPETPEETFLFETLSRNAAVRWWGASPEGEYSIVFEDIYKLRAQGLDPDRPAEKESEYQWRGQGMRTGIASGPKRNPPFVEKWLEKISNGDFASDMMAKYKNIKVQEVFGLLQDVFKLDQNG